nr:hypothetical protein [Tanacetum cinerariifolium]
RPGLSIPLRPNLGVLHILEADMPLRKKARFTTPTGGYEDDVDDDELDWNEEDNQTRWGRYADRLMKLPRSQPIGYYINEDLAEYINSPSWNCPTFYDDDDDEHSIQYKGYLENSSNAIAPVLPTEEPNNSLSIGDEHHITILETESDEIIKSSVENLVPIPSEPEVTSENKSECDLPVNDESSPIFTTFLNPLFDCNDDFTSSNDESLSNEDVPMENFKIYSNPYCDNEEIIPTKIDPHYFNVESNLLESFLNRDTLIDSSPKFDFLLEEFSGEITHINPIPSRIKGADFDLEEEIRLVENLLYDNSSPRPPEELNAEIADTIVDNDTLLLPENELSNFDHHDDLLFPRPPPKPPDVKIFFDFEPDMGVLTTKVVEDIFEHHVPMPKVLPSQTALCLNIDIFLPFSFENEDKVFKPGILSYLLISHQDKIISDFSKTPMMMYGRNIPHLDVLFLHFYPP